MRYINSDMNVWCYILFLTYSSLGGENLAVAQNTYAVTWFKEKELNMVFGLQLSFSRVVGIYQ